MLVNLQVCLLICKYIINKHCKVLVSCTYLDCRGFVFEIWINCLNGLLIWIDRLLIWIWIAKISCRIEDTHK